MTAESERSLLDAKVGDPIKLWQPSYHRSTPGSLYDGVVAKVARKYLTVDYDRGGTLSPQSVEVARADGRQKHGPNTVTAYLKAAWTPEAWERKERREAALGRVRPILRSSWETRYSTEQIERIAAILEEEVAP